ncbi:MAG: N-6 DNA methylase [Snowella sp.]|nr:N-6 DNA methylase [Snowella sp.]
MMSNTLKYCQIVSNAHRKSVGQFFTNERVAQFMVEWVLCSDVKELYDPAFGLGAFRPNDPSIVFSASEIDKRVIKFYHENSCPDISFLANEDYLSSWGKRHANIVCNPPYMRFQKFLNRDSVFQDFKEQLNLTLSGYTNTASAFLLKSLSELDGRGRLSYIMPLEFLNTGYGTLVKQKLLEKGHLIGIISLECEKEIFPDATTSVGILLYDCKVKSPEVEFYSIKSINELAHFKSKSPVSTINVNNLNPKDKWLPYLKQLSISFDLDRKMTVALEYYGRFSRGIATGANEFFVLSKSKAMSLGLYPRECTPCITRSSQITRPVISDKDIADFLELEKPVLLFSANGLSSKAAKEYIRKGESLGYHERFLTKHRTPWYKTEARTPAPLLLGVFSRGGYKIIRNKSNALNLTCYHGFHPNLFGLGYIDHLFLYLLSQTGRKIISLSMRSYGDSLDKFEPNDLNTASVPSRDFFDSFTSEEIISGMQYVGDFGVLPEKLELKFKTLMK